MCGKIILKKGDIAMYDEKDIVSNAGNINISEEVIAVVAGVAASEIKGVAGMGSSLTSGIGEFFGKKSQSKGIKIEMTEKDVKISVPIAVFHGCKIPDVAWEVQEKIKHEVENMTGLSVISVDIYVNAIVLPKEDTKTEEV